MRIVLRESRIAAFLLVIALCCPAICLAGKSPSVLIPDSGLGSLIKKKVAPSKKVIRGERIYSAVLVESFYKARNYQPAWSGDGRLTQIEKLILAVEEAYHDGLTPDYYHLSPIRSLVGRTKKDISDIGSYGRSRYTSDRCISYTRLPLVGRMRKPCDN